MARAYVAGDIDVEGDMFAFFHLMAEAFGTGRTLTAADAAAVLRTARKVGALGPRPPLPPEEIRIPRDPRHTRRRDRHVVSHHYDVGNDFYAIVLGPSLVYSCAYWSGPSHAGVTLADAQHDKLDLVCRKLDLRVGQRLLDVGCGWGSMALHAATRYGVRVVGVTLSDEQAGLARERVAEAGLSDRIEIRTQDYREVDDGPYDAISSIGMGEHVGRSRYPEYASRLFSLLRERGRLLNHQIARRPGDDRTGSPFIQHYVFPDGELSPVGETVDILERAGFEVRDVEALREHYAMTLREWVSNLEQSWNEAVALVGAGRARVWRAYMAASAVAFEANRIGVDQILAVKTDGQGGSGMPLVRASGWSAR
jgi:cyclopropane-fatty-acyl-phospholipid synthase